MDTLNPDLSHRVLGSLRDSVFTEQSPGQRCLLDLPTVQPVAISIRAALVKVGILSADAVAIQAIAFDKTKDTNWKVIWHQDVMFPFSKSVTCPAFELPGVKDAVHYARPPRDVLESMLAVRLHLDDCDEANGPLRVANGSHREGVLKGSEIHRVLEQSKKVVCLAKEGEALLMKPLLIHASSAATAPKHRRVLHLVYYSGRPTPERWHRAV